MDFERILQDVISIHQTACGSRISESDAKHVIRSLLSVRDTERIMQNSPRHLLQTVFENSSFYSKCVYPCDIIELRNILSSNILQNISKIILFSNAASERVIKDQKIRLIISLDPEEIAEQNNCDVSIFGGMAVFNTNCISISDCIDSIVVDNNDYKSVETVENITKELCPTCPVYTNSSIFGIDKYKFSTPLKLFEVNLPSMGINKEKCRSVDAKQALHDILSVKWDRHPDKNIIKRRPSNYTANFWFHSGFFDSIVREIGNHKKAEKICGELDTTDPPTSQKPIFALADYNGSVWFDKIANTHEEVIVACDILPSMIETKGFLIKGIYKQAANDVPSINCTPEEQKIFSIILHVAQKFNLKTQFRVAGGWVRDRLLDKPSDDIDIALDNITGKQFYEYCSKYAQAFPNSGIGKSYTVDQNIEKSKHLETVAIEIGGSKIDFVNLRSENYGSDSRVPTVEFGDPKTDAQRRDLTINAMFYNINTKQIEDYVGGIKDLQSMVLRTPLNPKKTFMDDPLRMLRVFRFFSRYPNAHIEQSTLDAMKDPEVHEAYRRKVSPERAGPEILKMFGAERPAEAIRALFETGMDKAVFDVPETQNLHPLTMDQRNRHHKFNLLEHTLRVVKNLDKLMKQKGINKKDQVNMLMAAVFHDYGKAHPEIGKPKENDPGEYGYVGHEDESAKIADSIMKRIGIGEADRKFVTTIITNHMRPHTDSWTNKSIGKFMRDTQIQGQDRDDIWEFVMMHAQADTMAKSEEGDQTDFDLKERHINEMRDYRNRPQPIQMKPIVDGFTLQKMFPNLSPKPPKGKASFIKYIQEKLMEEQFAGNITDQQQALAFVESIRAEVEAMYNEGKTAFSWYEKAKIVEASSDSFGSRGRLSKEGPETVVTNVKKMVYRPAGESSMVAIGDRYRSKGSGVAFEPSKESFYKIVDKKGKFVILEDENGEKQKIEIGTELPAKFIKV